MLAQLSLDLWTKIQLISPNQSTTPHTHRIMGGASMPKVSILLQNLNTQKNLNKREKMHIKNNLCVWKNRSTSENFAGTGPQEGGGCSTNPWGKKRGKFKNAKSKTAEETSTHKRVATYGEIQQNRKPTFFLKLCEGSVQNVGCVKGTVVPNIFLFHQIT